MAATKCIKACRRGSRGSAVFQTNVRIGKKCDLSDFDRRMIVGARQGALSISEAADLLRFFHTQQSLEFAENGAKNKKNPVSSSSVGRNHVLNERGQRRRSRLVKADRKVTVTQITTHYNSGMQKRISEHTTHQTTKWIGYQSPF